jgi:PAS domain S-box-containing protein
VLSRKKKIRLQEYEEVYRALFDDASDAIVIIDVVTQRVLEANRQAEALTSYTHNELLTMSASDFWVNLREKRLATRVFRAVAGQKSVKLHTRQLSRKDGQTRWVDITISAIAYQGKPAMLVTVRDVSHRKQLELEQEVIDAINNALISGQNIRELYKMIGQNLLKVVYFDWMDILLPGSTSQKLRVFASLNLNKNISTLEEREYVQKGTLIKTVFQTATPEIVNYRAEHSDRLIPGLLGQQLQASLFFPLEYQGKIIGVIHFGSYRPDSFAPHHFEVLRRITTQLAIAIENLLLAHKVNEENKVYKHLIENVNELVFQADPKGTIIFVNNRVRNVLGYTPEEIVGTNFFSYVFPEDLEEARAAFRLTLRHEQPLSGEYRVIRKDGIILTISIYTRPIFEDDHAVGMQAIIQDITPPPNRFSASRTGLHDLIGRSHRMQEIYALIMSVAETDSTVLIHGESGTGKELIAQAIHAYSHRKDKPFIVVNCSAYSEHLLESELFGHERGAFTGAHRRKLGRFELAKGGTIFLDEVGEIPLHSQLLLLRVIQNKTFERVGGEKTLETDVRIVAATNKNLVEEMKAGHFREDLYYRLNVISMDVPPLRERKEDIPYLVEHFLKKYARITGKNVVKCSRGTMELLMRHDWYGNVRELENAIERAVVMASGLVLTAADLPATLRHPGETLPDEELEPSEKTSSLYDQEKRLILQTLQATNWNKYQTAKLLGITRSTLYSKIVKHHLSPAPQEKP